MKTNTEEIPLVKQHITIPQDVYEDLQAHVREMRYRNGISYVVSEALRAYLAERKGKAGKR